MDVRETRFQSFKKRGSDVYWEKKRDSLRRMFSKPRKPSRYDTYGRLVSSTSHLNLISATYSVAPRRPPSDDLSSMFSRHLRDSVDQTTGVSKFVLWCVYEIETTGERLSTDAIYRAAGNQGRVQLIVYTTEENMRQVLHSEQNVNVLTGALKLFFRRLKMPIIDYRQFNQAFCTDSPTEDLHLLINGLPAVERNTLSFLMQHLQKVLALQSENKMGIASLGVVFGPTLMRLSPDSVDIASDMKQQNRLFEYLLTHYEAIFPPRPGHDATLDLNSLYSVVNKKLAQRRSGTDSSDGEEGRRVATAATVEIDGGRPRSDSESSDGKMRRVAIAATVGIPNTGRQSNTDSSDSERERRLIDAINKKLKKHQVSQSSDISRPNSQLQNSTASTNNRPAAAKYNSSSSDSDESHSKRRILATTRPASIPVRPAPSLQDAQRNSGYNNTTSYKPSSVGNLEENSNKGGSTSRPASRPSALPPAPPALVVHRNPVSHQTSSSDSDKSDNERPKITTKRIVRPVAIPVPPTPPAPVPAASEPVVYVAVRNPLRKHKSSSESDKSDGEQRNKTPVSSNRYPLLPAQPSTSAPVLIIRKSISRRDTSSSDSDKRRNKQGNKSSVSSYPPTTKPIPPPLPTTSPPVLVMHKSLSGDDSSGSDSDERRNKKQSKIPVSSNRPATKPIPPPLPSTSPPVLVIRKSRSGDDTSSSDSDKRRNKKQSKIPVSSNRPATKPIPPPLPSTSPPGISGDDTSGSDSDKRRNKLRNTTSVSSNHPTTKPIPPALPSTPRSILVVRKSHTAGDTSSSESDKNNTEHTTANSKNYFSHKSYEVQSSSKQDSKGNQSINVDYTLKSDPIYSNQDEIDAIRTISSRHNIHNTGSLYKLTGAKGSKYEDVFVNPNENLDESLYSIDTYRNRQIQRLSAAFDSPTDMDTASAFARQLSDQHFMTSLDSSRRITKHDKTSNVVIEIPTVSDQSHSSITSAAYSTVSHQQKFKQTSYQQQSKVVKATQLSVTSRKERSDSDSSFSSPSGSEDSQRVQVTQLSIRNVPTAI